ncbi:R-spondin-2-like isoform X1 [Mytilus edulis]|uniref:R-spondin-2-like isoform X1 n=2 Tax=Mytilus edulis TaxID=6550 RepID=UPI0039EEED07
MILRILLTLNLMLYSTVYSEERTKRSCNSGCIRCSEVNGCYKCRPRLFLYLARTGMRQTGHCIHSCPKGYFGVRHEDYSICNKCQLDHCNACFSNGYCTQCKHPYISYRGRCTESCPDGLYYANYSKDCRLLVDCMAGPWSSWTPCARNGQTCGYKYGITTRSREILEHPSPNGATCPSLVENRCCRMEMRHCADILHNQSEFTKWKSLSKHDRKILRRRYRRRKRRKHKNRHKLRKRKKKNETRKGKQRNKDKKRHKKKNRLKNKRKRRLMRRKEAWKVFCGNGIVFNDLNSIPLLD